VQTYVYCNFRVEINNIAIALVDYVGPKWSLSQDAVPHILADCKELKSVPVHLPYFRRETHSTQCDRAKLPISSSYSPKRYN